MRLSDEQNHSDFDFAFDFIEWCKRNGVGSREEVNKLFALVNKYYLPRYEPAKSNRSNLLRTFDLPPSYPDYKALRIARGLQAQVVAAATGLSKTYISYVENRQIRTIGPEKRRALDVFFGLSST